MRSEIAIDVAAPPRRVFDLASDITCWPERLPHYREVTLQSHDNGRVLAAMAATRRFGPVPVPVSWLTEQWADVSDDHDLRLRFRHVGGVTRGMDVTWHIRQVDRGSRVTIEHVFSRRLPLLGSELLPRLIDRIFVRPIASRTLATFKSLAEAPI